MNDDNKIIRLTWITSFFHSLIAILLLIINVNGLLARHYANGLYIGKVAEYFVQTVSANHLIPITISITIFLFLAYSIIYPIGQWAIIHYLHDKNSTMKDAMKKWRQDFFHMFKAGILSVIMNPIILLLVAFKIIIIDGRFSLSIVIRLAIWFVWITIINNLKAYTRYFIVIDHMQRYDAMKSSFQLTIKNRKNTGKYMSIQTALLFNFSFNLILMIGIPFLIIYGAIARWVIEYRFVKVIVYLIVAIMILFGSYISAIIRAFFVYYRYEIYNITRKNTPK